MNIPLLPFFIMPGICFIIFFIFGSSFPGYEIFVDILCFRLLINDREHCIMLREVRATVSAARSQSKKSQGFQKCLIFSATPSTTPNEPCV